MVVETYRENPLIISKEAIDTTFRLLSGNPEQDQQIFFNKLLHTGISDILSPEFDCLRLGVGGWAIGIPEEDISKFNLKIKEVGPEGPPDWDPNNEGWDYFLGVGLMRGVVSNSFVEQATIDGKLYPRINSGIIDCPPFERSDIEFVKAHEDGVNILIVEDLDLQMLWENELLYERVMTYKDKMTQLFTARTIDLYKSQPDEFLEAYKQPVNDSWEKQLRECALRTYAWFTPNQPNLIPIPAKNS